MGYEHAFQPYTYSLRPFSRGGGRQTPPQAIHRFRPPSLFRVNHSFRIKCKLIEGMELFEEQYFKVQYFIVTRIEEGLNYLSTEIMYTACT